MSVAAEYEMPVFGEAVRQFGDFLVSQRLPSEGPWVFREDVCWRQRQLFVKVPIPEENIGDVESRYNLGVNRGLGVQLNVLCLLGTRPCCYIWLPSDEEDAAYAMTSGLTLSVPTQPVKAREVKSGLLWGAYKWQERSEAFTGIVERVPRRAG